METRTSPGAEGRPPFLETFLSGMETTMEEMKMKYRVDLETFLSGMETDSWG